MEISFGNNFGGNIGVRPETLNAGVENVQGKPQNPSNTSRLASNLEITSGASGIASGEPVADVPASELRRDDALGQLVNSVFTLPPPPMPNFLQ